MDKLGSNFNFAAEFAKVDSATGPNMHPGGSCGDGGKCETAGGVKFMQPHQASLPLTRSDSFKTSPETTSFVSMWYAEFTLNKYDQHFPGTPHIIQCPWRLRVISGN